MPPAAPGRARLCLWPSGSGRGPRGSRLRVLLCRSLGVTALTKDALQLWLAVVTIIVAIGALAFTLNGQLRDDLREVLDEVRALRNDVQDLGERVTRVEVLIEGGGQAHPGGRRWNADRNAAGERLTDNARERLRAPQLPALRRVALDSTAD